MILVLHAVFTYIPDNLCGYREQLAAQLIMRELLEQEKNIKLPPATSKTMSVAPV